MAGGSGGKEEFCSKRNIRCWKAGRRLLGELSYFPSKLGLYWEIHPLLPQDFRRPSTFPSGHLSGLRKSLEHWGWISQYLPRFGGARIQCHIVTHVCCKFQGLCSPSETRMVGVLWDSDGCCSGAPCKESPYKRGQSRKRTVLKKGESPKNLVKARQRTKSL